MKPQMILNMRISVDITQKQRYSENEILNEFDNHNVKLNRTLVIRKSDGAVLGEILTKNYETY
jgi:hypothetical protein